MSHVILHQGQNGNTDNIQLMQIMLEELLNSFPGAESLHLIATEMQ